MSLLVWRLSLLALALGRAVALPPFGNFARLSSYNRRDDDDFDPTDLSFITKMAAIGDSYSAGIGAGTALGTVVDVLTGQTKDGDFACRRYDQAYPYVINTDARLGDDPSKRTFQFFSCSGAVTLDVIEKQLPSVTDNQQVLLLSTGGNDVGLVDILNQCIYQFASFTKFQAVVGKLYNLKNTLTGTEKSWFEGFDWDKLSRTCEEQLDASQALIDGSAFSSSLDAVLAASKAKLSSDGMIYYTGYAKFFAEDLSKDCNTVTWQTWLHNLHDVFQSAEYLLDTKRKRMNDLVDAVNQKLEDAINRAGPQVRFVNYDSWVGTFGGRMCETGVDEQPAVTNSRNELMFYELNALDPFGASPWKRSNDGVPNGTFQGSLELLARLSVELDTNPEFSQKQYFNDTPTITGNVAVPESGDLDLIDLLPDEIPNLLPDGYGRVFHPQVNLHALIANLVIWEMVDKNVLDHGGDGVPEIFTPTASVCEYTKAPGATGTPCSSNNDCSSPTCFGLGVAFRCVQGTCSCQGRTPPTTTSKAIITAAPTVTSSWPFTSDACFNSAISNYGGNFGAWCSVYGMSNLAVMPCTSVHDIHAMTDCFSSKTAGGPVYTVPYADKMEQACVTDSHQYSNAYQYLSSACYHANNYFVTRGPYTGDIN